MEDIPTNKIELFFKLCLRQLNFSIVKKSCRKKVKVVWTFESTRPKKTCELMRSLEGLQYKYCVFFFSCITLTVSWSFAFKLKYERPMLFPLHVTKKSLWVTFLLNTCKILYPSDLALITQLCFTSRRKVHRVHHKTTLKLAARKTVTTRDDHSKVGTEKEICLLWKLLRKHENVVKLKAFKHEATEVLGGDPKDVFLWCSISVNLTWTCWLKIQM